MKENIGGGAIVELYKFSIHNDPNVRIGKIVNQNIITEDDLIDMVVARGTDLSRFTLRASLSLITEIAEEMLLQGSLISSSFVSIKLCTRGSFERNNPFWDSDKHSLYVDIRPNKRLKETLKHTTVTVRGMSNVGTAINTVTDISSGEVNGKLTPGGAIRIKGKKVKIAGDDPDNGVKLISVSDGSVIAIPPDRIVENRPSQVLLILPESVPPGQYRLKVATQFSSTNRIVRVPRTYTLEQELWV